MSELIKIGSRKSKLAMWQTHYVAGLLEQNGMDTQIIPVDTRGDRILDVSISKIGTKGVFTEELESMLKDGTIDIAVHSAKDLQSDLGDDLEVIAFTEREKPNDVLVSIHRDLSMDQQRTFRIGTSSTRRVALVRHFHPQIEIGDIRGNLQTRIIKMKEGQCDALLLAYAGIHRMNYDSLIVQELELEKFTPPVGQGSIALEASVQLDPAKRKRIRGSVNHVKTEACIRAERSFLKKLEGGCSIPAFGYCSLSNEILHLRAGIISLDGKKMVVEEKSGNINQPLDLGTEVAEGIFNNDGKQLLDEIRRQL